MEKEYKGKLIFYDEQINVLFPSNFDKFQVKLGEMLGLTDDILSNIRLSYKDEEGDKVEVKVSEDYNLFIDEIKKGKRLMELSVEVKEESSLLIKKCSSSIINYVSKNNSGNINNLSEQIKEQHKSLELSDEINPNDIPKVNDEKKVEKANEIKNENIKEEKKENEKEIKNENIKKEENINNNIDNNIINNNIDNNNIINNNDIKKNSIDNNIIINDPIENNNIPSSYKVILDNNINNINNINNGNDINQNINNNQNNIRNNNIKNNNIENNNNINNINNQIPQRQQVRNPQNSIPQFSQVQNQNQQSQSNLNQNPNNKSFLYIFSFPYSCTLCGRGPIYRSMYYCSTCKYIICPQCELKEGPQHKHPLYKVQNITQFDALNIGGVTQFDKFVEGVGNQFESAYNSVLGFFGANNNNNNNNNNINNNNNNNQIRNNIRNIDKPQWVSLVQIARANYDLRNITDKQIEEALIKTRGNIDEAVISLFGQ